MTVPKTAQLLTYIVKHYGYSTVTSFMKLAYLIDLISVEKIKKQISSFTYKRYLFGPFDKIIYVYLSELVGQDILREKPSISPMGDEYIIYEYMGNDKKVKFDLLNRTELSLMDSVLNELQGLGAKALSQVAYATEPMKKLGATMNNRKGLNKTIDLNP